MCRKVHSSQESLSHLTSARPATLASWWLFVWCQTCQSCRRSRVVHLNLRVWCVMLSVVPPVQTSHHITRYLNVDLELADLVTAPYSATLQQLLMFFAPLPRSAVTFHCHYVLMERSLSMKLFIIRYFILKTRDPETYNKQFIKWMLPYSIFL